MKSFKLLLLFLFVGQIGFGQGFVSPDNQWVIREWHSPMGSWFFLEHTVYFDDIVIVGGVEYYRLNVGDGGPVHMHDNLYREADGKVYLLNGNGEERLLYDFNMNVGDKVVLSYDNSPDPIEVECVAVDFIQLGNGENRKRLTIQNYNSTLNDYWVEGVGGISHTMNTELMFVGPKSELCSFAVNNSTVYGNAQCTITGLSEIEISEIKIIPNPTTSSIRLDYNSDLVIKGIKIIDVLGSIVGNELDPVIDLDAYSAGVYYLNIEFEGNLFVTKRVIKL